MLDESAKCKQFAQTELLFLEVTKKLSVSARCITKEFKVKVGQLLVDICKLGGELHDGSMVTVLVASEAGFVFEHRRASTQELLVFNALDFLQEQL